MKNFIKSFLPALLVLLQVHFAIAQTAAILPLGETQFFDNNGNPLTSGTVDFYAPNTTNRMTTWRNAGETIVNTNPVILDAAGRAIIYGQGTYRQVVKDSLGNLIWDQLTAAPGTSGGGATNVGDGNAVGTIKMWAGLVAPAQYQFAYGQQVLRASFPDLFNAITLTSSVICTSGSTVLSGIVDTTQIAVGSNVEVSCVPGTGTVIAVTSSTVTLSSTANISTTVNAIFFPFGNGNGATTFTLPDLRGYVIAGRDNMGGTAASRLTSQYFGKSADALAANGGSQNVTLTLAEMVGHTHNAIVTDPGHDHTFPFSSSATGSSGAAAVTSIGTGGSTATTTINTTGITVTTDSSGGGISISASRNEKGGIAESTAIAAGGSGYTNGTSKDFTITGGTCSTQPVINVIVAGGIVTQINSVTTAGTCTVYPTNPAASTPPSGGGTGATFNAAFVGTGIVAGTVQVGGSGYTNGLQTGLTILGGICTTQPIVSVFVTTGAVTSVSAVTTAGVCAQFPINPVSFSGGGGTGATLNIPFNPGGSTYTNGARIVTATGGTCTTQPQFNATVTLNQITTIGSQITASNCSIAPSDPAPLVDAGGVAASATINTGGSSYTSGSQVLTVLGGTCTTQPQFTVNVISGVIASVTSLTTAGACTINPTNPAATTGGGGAGATLNVSYTVVGSGASANIVYGPQSFATIQPTITLNYVVKVLPDASLSTSNVVTSINGASGAWTCSGIVTCSGNIITATGGGSTANLIVGTSTITGGSTGNVIFNNGGLVGEYTKSGTGSVALTTSPTFTTPTLGAALATSVNGLIISTTTGTLTVPAATIAFSGANNVTFTSTGTTTVTLPTSGTLLSTGVTSLPSLVTVSTLTGGGTGAGFTLALGTSTLTGQVPVANGGTGLSSGTSGGILGFTASGTIASSVVLGSGLPVVGGGAGATPTAGTKSGTGTKFATTTISSSDNGNCVSIDGSGNLISAGGACTTGGAGGTVSAGTVGNLAIYAINTTTVASLANCANGYYGTDVSNVTTCKTSVDTTLSATITTLGTIASGVWTGTSIALANGGTNANLTASNGGIVYSTASALAILAGTVTANQCLLSGSSAAPSWGSCAGTITIGTTTIGSGTNGRVLYDNSGVFGELPVTGSAGNVVLSTSPTIASPTLTGTVTGPAGTWTASGLNLAGGGLGITSGTSGGVPYFSSTSTVASSGALTSGMPIFGGGAGGAPVVGTKSGTGTELATVSGSLTSQNCIKADASGNLVDAGTTCANSTGPVLLATLSGGGTVYTDNTHITSTYNSYTIVINELIPANATNTNNNCMIRVQVSSSDIITGYVSLVSNPSTIGATASPTFGIPCTPTGVGGNLPNNGGIGVSGTIIMTQPNFGSSGKAMFTGTTSFQTAASTVQTSVTSAFYNTNAVINGISIMFTNNSGTQTSSGITSGTIKIYGNP